MKRFALAFTGLLCAGQAFAQTAESLDLRLPETDPWAPAGPVTSRDPPGTYYGDTRGSGASSAADAAAPDAAADGKARVRGSFTTGIGHSKAYGTSHYNAAEVNVSKAFGEGDTANNVNLQIRVEQSDGPGFGDPRLYPSGPADPFLPPPR